MILFYVWLFKNILMRVIKDRRLAAITACAVVGEECALTVLLHN